MGPAYDQYALAVAVYHALCGELPHPTDENPIVEGHVELEWHGEDIDTIGDKDHHPKQNTYNEVYFRIQDCDVTIKDDTYIFKHKRGKKEMTFIYKKAQKFSYSISNLL